MNRPVWFFLQFGFAAAVTLVLTISVGIRAETHFASGEMWPAVGQTALALFIAALNALYASMLAAGVVCVLRDGLDAMVYGVRWEADESE